MITHKLTKTSDSEVTLAITVQDKFIAPYKQAVLKRLKKDLKVDGFRPGNVPDAIAERELGSEKVQAEVLQEVLMHAYTRAVREEKLETVASPQISLKKFVPYSELEFEALVAIMPDIKIDLTKLKVKPEVVKVSSKEVDDTLDNMRSQGAKKTESAEAIKDGDEVVFDFTGVREGKPVEGASATNHRLTVGGKSFIPGFEEELVGLKKGAKKTFTITFPRDYHAKDLAGQDVEFSIEIKQVESVDLPKLDDAWAKTVGPVKDLKGLKDEIKKSLEQNKQSEADKVFESKVLESAIELAGIKAPQSLVAEQVENLRKETEQNLQNSGLDVEKYLQLQGQKPEDFDKQLKTEAEKRVKLGLVLRGLIAQEKITVSQDEVSAEIARMKQQYTDPKILEEMTHSHFEGDVKNHLLTTKAIAILARNAAK